jgi:transposase
MGKVSVLCPKRLDLLNLLYWDGLVMVMAKKWLEDNSFSWPVNTDGLMHLTQAQFKRCAQALTGDGCTPNLVMTSSG